MSQRCRGRPSICVGQEHLTRHKISVWLARVSVAWGGRWKSFQSEEAGRPAIRCIGWLDGRSHAQAILVLKASFPSTAPAGANGSCKFCIAEVRAERGAEASM